jgi:dTDP-4-dehydrorhamnose 3,5-epimerase
MKKIVRSIKIIKKEIIKNKKGNILKFISQKDLFFKGFGEIYFSQIKKNKVKGWNLHKKHTCLICVPYGKVSFSIYDSRIKKIIKVIIGPHNNKIIQIPPGFWFSFKSIDNHSIVANLMNYIHLKSETKKTNVINGIKIS